jgi:hypothetical protein
VEKIIGRQEEQRLLEKIFNSKQAEFLAIYGRRRVGKTYLIRNYFKRKSCYFLNVTGINQEPLERQIKEFMSEVGRVFYHGASLTLPNNWFDVFELITELFTTTIPQNKKIILFFDEFPWMATHRSRLLNALDYYWNQFWSDDKRIKLIICGSSASWIIKNIINNRGGLHNRLTQRIHLEPMNLKETRRFLQARGIKLTARHITHIYMLTGGIPYYLTNVTAGLSSSQIIEKLAFAKNSFLLNEFNNLFSSLFDNAEVYIQLIRLIAKKRNGLSQKDLFKALGENSKGGTILNKLHQLEDVGFIMSFKPYQNQKKGVYYKVIDEYTLFYLYWIEPIKNNLQIKGVKTGYWQKIQNTPAWYAWAGYAFEAICYKHIAQIHQALNLSVLALPTTWQYIPKAKSDNSGAQIDLLFERDDEVITICEIKYTEEAFVIDKNYAQNLKNKIEIFKEKTNTKKQIFLAFISANGLKKTIYSEALISGIVTLEDLFK